MSSQRVTAEMVARHAGTSVSTVSLVVNGKDRGRVSAGLRERVRAAVDELGYVVDQTASALARGRGDLVILFVPDPGNPFFAEVVRGAREVLDGRYRLLMAMTRHGDQPTVDDVADHTSFRPAGMLIDAPTSGFLGSLPAGGLAPAVLLDAPDCPSSVNFDLQPGIRALVEHLAAAGHRRFGYLDTRAEVATYDARRTLLGETAAAAGLTMVPRVARADVSVESAAREVGRQLPDWLSDGATAVVAATDTMAYGVLAAARAAHLDVPGQLAVAGFDDLPTSAVTGPPLTSVALSGSELGRQSATRLLAAIDGSPTTAATSIGTRLVVRESTAGQLVEEPRNEASRDRPRDRSPSART